MSTWPYVDQTENKIQNAFKNKSMKHFPQNRNKAINPSKLKKIYNKHRSRLLEPESLQAFGNTVENETPRTNNSKKGSQLISPIHNIQRLNLPSQPQLQHQRSSALNSTNRLSRIKKIFHNHINSINLDMLKVFLKYCSLPVYGLEFKNYLELINDLKLGINEQNRSFTQEITFVFKQFGIKVGRTHYIFYESFTESLKALYGVRIQIMASESILGMI